MSLGIGPLSSSEILTILAGVVAVASHFNKIAEIFTAKRFQRFDFISNSLKENMISNKLLRSNLNDEIELANFKELSGCFVDKKQ